MINFIEVVFSTSVNFPLCHIYNDKKKNIGAKCKQYMLKDRQAMTLVKL